MIFVFFQVDNKEIPAHRNVLACVSPYLMDLFSAEQVNKERMTIIIELLKNIVGTIINNFLCNLFQNACNDGNIPSYRLNGYITKEGLKILVEYAYTAQLEVPEDMVK